MYSSPYNVVSYMEGVTPNFKNYDLVIWIDYVIFNFELQ